MGMALPLVSIALGDRAVAVFNHYDTAISYVYILQARDRVGHDTTGPTRLPVAYIRWNCGVNYLLSPSVDELQGK